MSLRATGTCSRLAASSTQYKVWHARRLWSCWNTIYMPYGIAWPSNADAAWSICRGRCHLSSSVFAACSPSGHMHLTQVQMRTDVGSHPIQRHSASWRLSSRSADQHLSSRETTMTESASMHQAFT